MLNAVKLALRITTNAYDAEIQSLIESAYADLGIVGLDATLLMGNPLYVQAVKTYVRMNFGSPSDYERLKSSYDEQKAQMQTASGYGGGIY